MDKLVEDLRAFSAPAFQEFVSRFRPRIRKCLVDGGIPDLDADDLSMTLMTDTVLFIDRFDARHGRFDEWVLARARSARSDYLRRWSGLRPVPLSEDMEALMDASSEDGNPIPLSPERLRAVNEALGRLPPADQELVRLRMNRETLSFADIGDELGIPPSRLRVRYFRALKRLRSTLSRDPRVFPGANTGNDLQTNIGLPERGPKCKPSARWSYRQFSEIAGGGHHNSS
jgi:RNA polymerase sigma factor (sigma-70 family)